MARGGQKTLKDQMAAQDTVNKSYGGAADALNKQLTSAYSGIVANPMSDAEKQARTQGVLQPLAESFDAMGEAAANRVARTGNQAGYTEALDKMAQMRGQQTAQANQALTADIGNTDYQRRMQALGAEQGMWGTDVGAQTGGMNTSADLAKQLAQIQAQPGFWSNLATSFAGGVGQGLGGLATGGIGFGMSKIPGMAGFKNYIPSR